MDGPGTIYKCAAPKTLPGVSPVCSIGDCCSLIRHTRMPSRMIRAGRINIDWLSQSDIGQELATLRALVSSNFLSDSMRHTPLRMFHAKTALIFVEIGPPRCPFAPLDNATICSWAVLRPHLNLVNHCGLVMHGVKSHH